MLIGMLVAWPRPELAPTLLLTLEKTLSVLPRAVNFTSLLPSHADRISRCLASARALTYAAVDIVDDALWSCHHVLQVRCR